MRTSPPSWTGSPDVVHYAEVIGDPIAQSKSPLIHKHWLNAMSVPGDYRAVRVAPGELQTYLETRRADPDWRGCNVTIPHKEKVMAHLDHVEPGARQIGAVNCIYPGPNGITGGNTDIDGVAAALRQADLSGRKAALIGAGGGARAAIRYLADQQVEVIALVVRDPDRASAIRRDIAGPRLEIYPLDRCEDAMEGSEVIINASPMGMEGAAPMPPGLIACAAAHAHGRTVFDMVYKPLETDFLSAARANGGTVVDGLTMLVGQARAAFELFYGRPAPADDDRLRALLTA